MHPTFGSVVPLAMFYLQPYSTLTGQTRDVTLTDQNASQNCLISLINNFMAFTLLEPLRFPSKKNIHLFALFASWLENRSLPGFSVESILPAVKDGYLYKNIPRICGGLLCSSYTYLQTRSTSLAGFLSKRGKLPFYHTLKLCPVPMKFKGVHLILCFGLLFDQS